MKDSGFSLIEVIVVLIILGVLAAIALPNFFTWVEKSRTAEAYNQIGIMTKAIEACYYKESDAVVCAASLNLNSSQYSTKYFDYQYVSPSSMVVYVIALRNDSESINGPGGVVVCPVVENVPSPAVPTDHYGVGLEINFTGGSIQTADCFMGPHIN